jgi:hypothetical protein
MSEKGADSRRQDVSGESSVLGQLGRDLVHKSFSIRKQGDDWVPYVGPRGGEGWKNPETGEVIYGDLSDVDEQTDGDVGHGESQDSGQVDEDFTGIDRDDIDEGQYLSVDGGEVEGYVETVDRLGVDVRVMLEDGSSFWIEDDMQLSVDDSPETEELRPNQDTYDIVDESISFDERDGWLDAQQVEEKVVDDLARTKSDDVVDKTADHITDVREERVSYYNPEDEYISVRADDMEETVSHELGHAIMGANGFHIKEGANLLATLKNSGSGDLAVDLLGNSIREILERPKVQANMSDQYISNVESQVEEEYIDGVDTSFDENYISMSIQDEAYTEELVPLVNEINSSLSKMLDDIDEGSDDSLFAGQYAVSNGQEVFAALHEKMQMDGLDPNSLQDLVAYHEELVDEYLNHFEPNDYQKQYINRLFQSEGSIGSIEEMPFPEVGTYE